MEKSKIIFLALTSNNSSHWLLTVQAKMHFLFQNVDHFLMVEIKVGQMPAWSSQLIIVFLSSFGDGPHKQCCVACISGLK